MGKRVAVVMAGGSGERFWPLSSALRPKQLLKLTHPDQTMLEEAVNRAQPLFDDSIFVSTSAALKDDISEAGVVPEGYVLAEPARRNTLGALVWVAAELMARGLEEATVAVVTADHKISEPDTFRATVLAAMEVAEATSGLVTIGITPTRAETGYGYIEVDRSQAIETSHGRVAYRSRRFLEKPSLRTASEFVATGNHLWNAGMFFYTLAGFRKELALADAGASQILDAVAAALRLGDTEAAIEAFELLPNISIDFALMAKAESVYVIPSDFPWDDVGAWDALERSLGVNSEGNTLQGRVVAIDSTGCVVVNDDGEGKVVGVVGISDLIVVATREAFLVCPKSEAQRVKQIVEQITAEGQGS